MSYDLRRCKQLGVESYCGFCLSGTDTGCASRFIYNGFLLQKNYTENIKNIINNVNHHEIKYLRIVVKKYFPQHLKYVEAILLLK